MGACNPRTVTRAQGLVAAALLVAAVPARADAPPVCTEGIHQPGPTPPRRLTRLEYNNTIRDLLGDDSRPADIFAAEESALGFNNNATVMVVSPLLAEQLMRAAEAIAERATRDLKKLLPCPSVACGRTFVETLGQRAFRRPLEPEERQKLLRLFDQGRRTGLRAGLEAVIQAVLQAPPFLYRDAPASKNDAHVAKLDGWALAARLSYFLWATMPDERLFAAAAAGTLETPVQVQAEARRMLADPRARAMVTGFHRQWLTLDRIDRIDKSRNGETKDFNSALNGLFREEIETFLDWAVWDGGGDLPTMLTSSISFLNGPIATFYRMPGVEGREFQKVAFDPAQRSGFLTSAGMMSLLAKPNQTSPILRGKFVREKLLCELLPDPPANVEVNPPKLDPKLTTRERFAEHTNDVGCNKCHRLIDPVGFGFEAYDALGRYRATENGHALDVSGDVKGSDVAGAFEGAVELTNKLADSTQVRSCVVAQWFRFAYGRGETPDDRCTLAKLEREFAASGLKIQDLLVALTQTDAFLYREGAPR